MNGLPADCRPIEQPERPAVRCSLSCIHDGPSSARPPDRPTARLPVRRATPWPNRKGPRSQTTRVDRMQMTEPAWRAPFRKPEVASTADEPGIRKPRPGERPAWTRLVQVHGPNCPVGRFSRKRHPLPTAPALQPTLPHLRSTLFSSPGASTRKARSRRLMLIFWVRFASVFSLSLFLCCFPVHADLPSFQPSSTLDGSISSFFCFLQIFIGCFRKTLSPARKSVFPSCSMRRYFEFPLVHLGTLLLHS